MAKYGRTNMVKRVFDGKQGHQITEDTISRAFMECCKGETRWPIAKLFLDRGAEVDFIDPYAETPLIACARKSAGSNQADKKSLKARRKVAMLLMERGAEANHKNVDGNDVLAIACSEFNEKFALMICKKGADIMNVQRWMMKDSKNASNWVAGSVLANFAFKHPKFKEHMKQEFLKRFDPDGSGDLDKNELLSFLAYHFKMAFKAGLKPTSKFHDDGTLEIDQIKDLIKERCPDVISQYTRLDTSRDGKYSWDELEPIVQDFYVNMWNGNRPEGLQDEGEYEDSDDEIELENDKVKKKKVATSSGMAGQLHPDWKAIKDPKNSFLRFTKFLFDF